MKATFALCILSAALLIIPTMPATAQLRDQGPGITIDQGQRSDRDRERQRDRARTDGRGSGISIEMGREGPAIRIGREHRRASPCEKYRESEYRYERCLSEHRR